MLTSHFLKIADDIESRASDLSTEGALTELRRLGLSDFALFLMNMPNPRFPKLSKILPQMASEGDQKRWTGGSGLPLLEKSVGFVRTVASTYVYLKGRPLQGSSILDFGCGYGRIIRPMYFYTDPQFINGIDPMADSLQSCRQNRMAGHFAQSEYLPSTLPVSIPNFDLIYAFSVFTHLSERATKICLSTLRKYVSSEGLLVVTIRPHEYWWHNHPNIEGRRYALGDKNHPKIADHLSGGFSFVPHPRPAIDGDLTYGDTSMSLEWLQSAATGWKVAGVDRSLNDSLQTYVFLEPV